MLELFKIAGRIDLEGADKASSDIDRIEGKGKGLAGRIGGVAKTVGKGALVIGGAMVAAGGAAFAMTQKVTGSFDNIAKTSKKLGVTSDAYQVMDYWAGQNGISTNDMERAVGRLNQRIGLAASGNEKYAGALEQLGVDMGAVKDGTLSTEDAMAQSIQTLSQMSNEQEKSALASELFGTKLARELMPALQDGSLSLEDAKKKAEELGFVIEEDTLSAAEHFNDTWDDLTRAMGAFGQKIFAQLMPAFQTMMDWILANMPAIQAIFKAVFDVISTVFSVAVNWIQSLIAWLNEWFGSNQAGLSNMWQLYQQYFTMIWGYIQEAYELIKSIITTAMAVIGEFLAEKLAMIVEFWQENGAQVIEAVQNFMQMVKSIFEFLMPAILFVVEMVWGLIKGVIDGALNTIMGLVKIFSGLFTGDWSKMWEGVKQLLKGALQLIWNLINLTLIGRTLALVRNFVKLGISLFRNFGTSIVNFFRNMGNSASNLVSSMISRVLGFFRNMASGAVSAVSGLISRVLGFFRSLASGAGGIVSGLVSRVLGFFRSMGSGISGIVRGIFSAVTGAFRNILSFITGLRSSFFNAGKGLIGQIVKGITGSIGNITSAVKGVASKIRGFLPFSPAKEGPLSDLDKLDFEGPIGDSIEKGESSLAKKMREMLGSLHPSVNMNVGGRPVATRSTEKESVPQPAADNSMMIGLLQELIQAVKDGKNIIVDNKVLGEVVDDEQGRRIGLNGRRVAF